MKKLSLLICLLCAAIATSAAPKSDATYQSIRQQYRAGRISADSVVSLALYHKVYDPQLAEQCLKLVNTPRADMELGVLYAFSPEFAKHSADGLKLLQRAAQSGQNEANCYLGLYYFNHKDYSKAKTYLDACHPQYGIGYTALGSMYTSGSGVKQDLAKARENFRQAALKGYPRGMALYGFNLRANAGGAIDYPDSFFWLYIAGDLGDDAARVTLFLPMRGENRGDSETAQQAFTALQFIQKTQSGKKIQNEPIYRDGFLQSLKERENAAEQGDDWARYYLGSMNYNGDFLNQNYAQVLHYYVPIAQNGKLPRNVLAVVNQRLAELYRDGKGTKADPVKAERHTRLAAHYGSLPAYKTAEHITD
ncbi:MAG: sel1 repeat family protein [Paramuribaculum sp.]|nr:sel1 repeat family protein [Paramuribaculum sp.]